MWFRLFCWLGLLPAVAQAQMSRDSVAFFIREVYQQTYREEIAYDWLRTLTKDIGPRLSGSEGAERAVDFTYSLMEGFGLDSVWRQPVLVPHWERGAPEVVWMETADGSRVALRAVALGNSPGTTSGDVRAEVVSVMTLDALRALPDEAVKGKIVFFNRPMDKGMLSTFGAYGGAADQRTGGPALAASRGAVAAVVRSLSTRQDDFPHTGTTIFPPDVPGIPAVAVSTNDADRLTQALAAGPVHLSVRTHCRTLPDAMSYNVIGEIRGSVYPEEIVLVGGHLDSWDLGEGAHDDGAGCVQGIELIRCLNALDLKPKRTIRVVFFMNEENGLLGGRTYADSVRKERSRHILAIESDAGGFSPRGLGMRMNKSQAREIRSYRDYFLPLGVYDFDTESAGADISPLGNLGVPLMELIPDNQRYFELHHTDLDVFEQVNHRELKLGAVVLTSLVYLISEHGLGH